MVRERLENQMRLLLKEIDRCELQVRAAEAARGELDGLRAELRRVSELYTDIDKLENAERKLRIGSVV